MKEVVKKMTKEKTANSCGCKRERERERATFRKISFLYNPKKDRTSSKSCKL